jgi:aryl-alcohol dehydrogenase-like predicted oxidoreductase
LAWVLAQGREIIPIPGTKRLAYLEDNMGGAKVTLSAEELREIDEILPVGRAVGDRYHPQGMLMVNG